MDQILRYFPDLTVSQIHEFEKMGRLYEDWNQKINVISRNDIEHLYERHVLHSLVIGKIIRFQPGSRILDVGTGGGFPGIPLAILFPDCNFLLIDSIAKKIKVVQTIAEELQLKNVKVLNTRVEGLKEKFDFIVSRAVTAFPQFVRMVEKNIASAGINSLPNGILYLKGGDFSGEIKSYGNVIEVFNISDYYNEPFFLTKKVIFLPYRGKREKNN